MAEATKLVQTLDDAVQAYRGEERFCKAFEISAGTLKRWRGIARSVRQRILHELWQLVMASVS